MFRQIGERLKEAGLAVLPALLVVLATTMLFVPVSTAMIGRFLLGIAVAAFGLFLFLVGVQLGLLSLGERLGATLTTRGSMALLLGVAFVMTAAATLAEPAVLSLVQQVADTGAAEVTDTSLLVAIGAGVGLSAALGMLRVVLGWPVIVLYWIGYCVVFLLVILGPAAESAIAFDSGGATTGPFTVPLLLSFSVGVTSVLSGRSTTAEQYGLVGIASIGPIAAVSILLWIAR